MHADTDAATVPDRSMQEPTPAELSPLFESADMAAKTAKHRVQRVSAMRSAFVVLAAVGGATDLESGGHNWSGVLAAAAFAIALLLEVELHRSGARRVWLHTRMLAETVRTLAWRYAVAGPPFPARDVDANRRFLGEVQRVVDFATESEVEIRPSVGSSLTDWMKDVRAMSWPRRAEYYLRARVYGQQEFFHRRAHAAKRAAEWWGMAMLVLDALGVGGGVLKAANILHVDTLGITAALIAGIGAWLEMNQHSAVANSYSAASLQLPSLVSRLTLAKSESEWRSAVDACEVAMNTERVSWGGVHGVELALDTDEIGVSDGRRE